MLARTYWIRASLYVLGALRLRRSVAVAPVCASNGSAPGTGSEIEASCGISSGGHGSADSSVSASTQKRSRKAKLKPAIPRL